MNYTQPQLKDHTSVIKKLKIGIVSAGLSHLGAQEAAHSKLVRAIVDGALTEMSAQGIDTKQIVLVECPGVLEIPLMARHIIREYGLDGVIGCALIVDGGMYRHEFVAQASLDQLMAVSLETDTPIASSLLTPVKSRAPETQFDELLAHLQGKGKEGAGALLRQIIQLKVLSGVKKS